MKRQKMDKQMTDIKEEREWYKNECQRHDRECQKRKEFHDHLKTANADTFQEKQFLEEQIKEANSQQEALTQKV